MIFRTIPLPILKWCDIQTVSHHKYMTPNNQNQHDQSPPSSPEKDCRYASKQDPYPTRQIPFTISYLSLANPLTICRLEGATQEPPAWTPSQPSAPRSIYLVYLHECHIHEENIPKVYEELDATIKALMIMDCTVSKTLAARAGMIVYRTVIGLDRM